MAIAAPTPDHPASFYPVEPGRVRADAPLRTGEDFGLLPCPLCAAHLKEIPAFSTTATTYLFHYENGCPLDRFPMRVADRDEERAKVTKWNTRP